MQNRTSCRTTDENPGDPQEARRVEIELSKKKTEIHSQF